jgi:TonB family protein
MGGGVEPTDNGDQDMRHSLKVSTFAFLIIWTCIPAMVHLQTSNSGRPHQDSSSDSVKSRLKQLFDSLNRNSTFKLLPNFRPGKDTAGFQLIPKNLGAPGDPTVRQDIPIPMFGNEPRILTKVNPTYPDSALRARLEGEVYLKLFVDAEGKVKEVTISRSDAEIFNTPAIEAAKKLVFTPAYLNGNPVAAWTNYEFRFQMPTRK